MDKNIYIQAIITLLMIGALIFLIFRLIRSLVIDSYRQALFDLRDRFFDEALNGKIPFTDPAYKFVRNSINGQIRYSHQISFWMILGMLVIYFKHKKAMDKSVDDRWWQATGHLDNETLHLVKKYHDESAELLLKYLFGLSPEFFPILFLLFGIAFIFGMYRKVEKISIALNKTAYYITEAT